MTWDVTYRLPSATLDWERIDAACRHVVTRWPFLAFTSRAAEYSFEVPAAHALAWEIVEDSATVARWAEHGYAGDTPVAIAIWFFVDDGVPEDDVGPSARFRFDTGWSGNGVCPYVAAKICEQLADCLGATEIARPVASPRAPALPYVTESRSITAVLDADSEWTANTVLAVLRGFGDSEIEPFDPSEVEVDDELDVVCFAPEAGWSVVLWPDGFHVNAIPISRLVSDKTDCIAVVVTSEWRQFWTMTVIDRGRIVDRYASCVGPLSERNLAAVTGVQGDAATAAACVNAPKELLARYYRNTSVESEARAFPDDEYPLSDSLVWRDLWRRLGIHIPGLDHAQMIVRLPDVAPWPAFPVDLGL